MDFPFVSVILPIRNEAEYIERSLGAVLNQDYPKECLEVLIADGMSTDKTRQIIKNLTAQYPQVRVNVVNNESKIVPTGMNLALQQAQGEIIKLHTLKLSLIPPFKHPPPPLAGSGVQQQLFALSVDQIDAHMIEIKRITQYLY